MFNLTKLLLFHIILKSDRSVCIDLIILYWHYVYPCHRLILLNSFTTAYEEIIINVLVVNKSVIKSSNWHSKQIMIVAVMNNEWWYTEKTYSGGKCMQKESLLFFRLIEMQYCILHDFHTLANLVENGYTEKQLDPFFFFFFFWKFFFYTNYRTTIFIKILKKIL